MIRECYSIFSDLMICCEFCQFRFMLQDCHRRMSEEDVQDEPSAVSIRRPFAAKLIRQLNHHQAEVSRRQKNKHRRSSQKKSQQFFQKFNLPKSPLQRSFRRLPEVNRNGNRIVGCWKNDQIQGEAQVYYHNGVTFKGVYERGIKVRGHFKFLNGYEYIGNCFGNKFTGQGALVFPSGKVIEGEWSEFKVLGKGTIRYPKGEVYYGQIQQFKKHGEGHLFFTDGSKYEGEFRNGLINGNGSYYVDGQVVSAGEWVDGVLQEVDPDGENMSRQQYQSHKDVDGEDEEFSIGESRSKGKSGGLIKTRQRNRNERMARNEQRRVNFDI